MIKINGSHLEGGGSIIRLSTALSAVTGKEVEIVNIRAGRQVKGLKTQHFHTLNAIKEFCNGRVEGARIGSQRIVFKPGQAKREKIIVRIPTAGSITMVLQNLVPAAVLSGTPLKVDVTGGTHVNWSPPLEYFQHVFQDFMKKTGCEMSMKTLKYGFYPKGGGHVVLDIKKPSLKKFEFLETGELIKIDVHSIASKHLQKARVAERQLQAFREKITGHEIKSAVSYVDTLSPGSCVHAHVHYEKTIIGVEVLGERGRPAEKIGKECANKLIKELESGAPVDFHMADQLIPFMTPGSSFKTSMISRHALTNVWVCEHFLSHKYRIKDGVVSCEEQ